LIERLFKQPCKFTFFQALRLIELWVRREAGTPGRGQNRTLDTVLRFNNSLSLSFPASEIEAISLALDAPSPVDGAESSQAGKVRQVRITPTFMGFLGVKGVLPFDYTATIAAQIAAEKNQAGRAFFDTFSQRSMMLFYRAWARSRIECRGDGDGPGNFLDVQLALAGRQRRALRSDCDALLADEVAARYAALIRHRPMQAEMLAGVLAEYFGVPFRCESLVGAWANLHVDDRLQLGAKNNVLGASPPLGARYWRSDALLRVWVGPLKRADFDDFLAGGHAGKALNAMLGLFAIPTVAFEVRPILRAADVSPVVLDFHTALGRGAVLVTTPPTADHDGARYHLTY
jgi:type VI secretion system protein ImpH